MARILRRSPAPYRLGLVAMLVHQNFQDIDQHAAQMRGFDQHYLQLSRGPFDGVFSSLELSPGVRLDVEWVAPSLHQRAGIPADTVGIGTFLELPGAGMLNGQPLDGRTGFVLGAGAEMDLCTPERTRVAVLTVPLAVLRRESAAWSGSAGTPVRLDAHARLGSVAAHVDTLLPVVRPLLAFLEANPAAAKDSRLKSSIEAQLLDGAMRLLHGRGDDEAADTRTPAWRRHRVFTTAREAIDSAANSEDDISIGTLCRLTGVSRRTLEYCFDDVVGVSPRRYLEVRKLNHVRRELTMGRHGQTTVGDVAARHGIWHLGRLSRQYRTMFGELPSATLRRATN